MSMLSTQIDELRELATRYDELQAGVVRAVRVPLNMGSVLREAADTIWQLRDDLQRAHRENAKLRELCKAWYKFSYKLFDEFIGEPELNEDFMALDDRMHELGIEVEA